MASPYALNNFTAPDRYSAQFTIEGVSIKRILVDTANQGIYWQLKRGIGQGAGGVWDDVEVYMAPGSRRLPASGNIVGVRIRAATPAASLPAGTIQAQVTVTAVT